MVIDLVRKNDWMPRDYHRQSKSIESARLALTEELNRPPSDEEIADYLQMDVKKCQKIQRMSSMVNVLSLDMVMGDDDERQPVQIPSTDIATQPERAFLREEALRILTKTKENEDGSTSQIQISGIYCIIGSEAWFKPVEILYNGEGFLLVQSASQDEKLRLRPGDEVIISAQDLYDGKVVRKT